jgi:hypothetical protein
VAAAAWLGRRRLDRCGAICNAKGKSREKSFQMDVTMRHMAPLE